MDNLDTAAARRLYEDLSPGLRRYLWYRGQRQELEDILMESFITLIRKMQAGELIEYPVTYLQRIADGHISNAARREQRRRTMEVPAGGFEELGELERDSRYALALAEQRFLTNEAQMFVTSFDSAVRALPEGERDAYLLTDLRGLTVRQAADVLDTYPMDVSRRAEAARTYLRGTLV